MSAHRLRITIAWVIFSASVTALAQQIDRGLTVQAPARRSALVVGMAAYPKAALQNTSNDGRDVANALKAFGFEVELLLDADQRRLSDSIDRWIAGLKGTEAALFFYSGHGIQIDGENFIVPVDFDAKDEGDAKHQGYSLDRIHDRMLRAGPPLNILIVDACRNNPFTHTRSTMGGLAPMTAGRGSFIAFATAPGSVASDNPGERNGLFTKHLLRVWQMLDLDLSQVFDRVRTDVFRESGERQLPWAASSVIGTFTFHDFNKDKQRLGSLADELKGAETELAELERQRQAASKARQEQRTKEAEAKALTVRDSIKAKQFEQEQLKQSLERQARIEEERRRVTQQEQQEEKDRQRRNGEMEERLADVRRQMAETQRELESARRNDLTLAQARKEVATLRSRRDEVVQRANATELAALRDLDRDYEGIRAELRKPVAPKDVFETTAQYEARLKQSESRRASIESKYQADRTEIQRRYAVERNSQASPYTDEIAKLTSRGYPAPEPRFELLDYNADGASLMMSINGQPFRFAVPPEHAKAIYTHSDLLRIDMRYSYSESENPTVAGLALAHPTFGTITAYTPVAVAPLVDAAMRLFQTSNFAGFQPAAELALKVGGELTFKLQHHHSGHLHETTLAFSRYQVRFDPQVPKLAPDQSPLALPCTYQPFTLPIGQVSSLEISKRSSAPVLELKLTDSKGKSSTLNFADRSARMNRVMVTRRGLGGIVSLSSPENVIESRPEAGQALLAILKAFKAAASQAQASTGRGQGKER